VTIPIADNNTIEKILNFIEVAHLGRKENGLIDMADLWRKWFFVFYFMER
jgi:hypothetical protein